MKKILIKLLFICLFSNVVVRDAKPINSDHVKIGLSAASTILCIGGTYYFLKKSGQLEDEGKRRLYKILGVCCAGGAFASGCYCGYQIYKLLVNKENGGGDPEKGFEEAKKEFFEERFKKLFAEDELKKIKGWADIDAYSKKIHDSIEEVAKEHSLDLNEKVDFIFLIEDEVEKTVGPHHKNLFETMPFRTDKSDYLEQNFRELVLDLSKKPRKDRDAFEKRFGLPGGWIPGRDHILNAARCLIFIKQKKEVYKYSKRLEEELKSRFKDDSQKIADELIKETEVT
jgi:hypothetical protein